MEPIMMQDVAANDLRWRIEHDASRCIMCGACVATCTLSAIEAVAWPRAPKAKTVTKGTGALDRITIRQKVSIPNACVGCGMCARVCPVDAIRPVRNPDDRYNLLARANGQPVRRGGRSDLQAASTLDSIVVGRISQMTDPALDSERHVFDVRAPFGQMPSARQIPLRVVDGKLMPEQDMDNPITQRPPVEWMYPLLFGDMSIGALSPRAWEALALATTYLNEECNMPVRMSSGEGGLPTALLESDYLKYFIMQIGSGHFGWNRILAALPRMKTNPAGVLIKIGQGAKPGDGGLLPAAKVAPHIQAIRGVPRTTLHSPPNHQGLYSIEESVQKMHLSLNAAFGFRVPVGIKCAASATSVSVYNNLLRDPYGICGGFFLDGIQGGTGAANEVSLDHTGHPVVSKLRDCYLAATNQNRQGVIPLWVGGGVGMSGNAAADAFKLICLGANGVFIGRVLLQIMGCVGNERGRCNTCATDRCPAGICTQDPRLVRRLDVDRAAQSVVDYMLAFDKELRKLMAPVGNGSLPVGRSDALVTTSRHVADVLQIAYAC